jgi:serine/threonine protein kinase
MDLSHFHIKYPPSFNPPRNLFPREDARGFICDASGLKFAHIQYGTVLFEGGYGILQLCERNGKRALVKVPKEGADLSPEALVQAFVRKTLGRFGLEETVPEVYDLFIRGRDVCFSMEYISGQFPHSLLDVTDTPGVSFLQILQQVALLLHILEKEIQFDHRDLKANNLYLRKQPVNYKVTLEEKIYHIKAPFQIVILDFGFACLGKTLNVEESIFSNTDPCPKEGRDLFHLVTSFWSIPSIRIRMDASLKREIDGWLHTELKDYGTMTKKFSNLDWVYFLTKNPNFTHEKLKPITVLKRIDLLLSYEYESPNMKR